VVLQPERGRRIADLEHGFPPRAESLPNRGGGRTLEPRNLTASRARVPRTLTRARVTVVARVSRRSQEIRGVFSIFGLRCRATSR
jgi:hypothetical protein